MELSTQEVEIPMPLNSVYGGLHAHTHVHTHAHTHAHQSNMNNHAHEHHNYQHHKHQDQPLSSSTTTHDNHNTNGMPIPKTTMPPNTNNNEKTSTPPLDDHELEQKDDQEVPYNNKDTKNNPNSNNNPTISIRYRECQKNHAASIGGKALDGCGEFMPSGEEGTIEALICCACNCHRNFHRKEIDCHHLQNQYPYPHHFYLPSPHPHPHHIVSTRGKNVNSSSGGGGNSSNGGFLGYPTSVGGGGGGGFVPMSRALPINVSYQVGLGARVGSCDVHEHEDDHGGGSGGCGGGGGGGVVVVRHPHDQIVKRRYRTKFSQEQKEKMLEFAQRVGWKIQNQESNVVQQFCQEIGIRRRVLKVWMHNNKHTFAKKCIDNNNNPNNTTSNLFN